MRTKRLGHFRAKHSDKEVKKGEDLAEGHFVLMIPVHLDALHLKSDRLVVEAMADFSRLPYFNGERVSSQ